MRPQLTPPSTWLLVDDGIYQVGAGYVVLGEIGEQPSDLTDWKQGVLDASPPGAHVVNLKFGALTAPALVIDCAEADHADIISTLTTAQLPPASLSQLMDGLEEQP